VIRNEVRHSPILDLQEAISGLCFAESPDHPAGRMGLEGLWEASREHAAWACNSLATVVRSYPAFNRGTDLVALPGMPRWLRRDLALSLGRPVIDWGVDIQAYNALVRKAPLADQESSLVVVGDVLAQPEDITAACESPFIKGRSLLGMAVVWNGVSPAPREQGTGGRNPEIRSCIQSPFSVLRTVEQVAAV
jgi:hypothetical protein